MNNDLTIILGFIELIVIIIIIYFVIKKKRVNRENNEVIIPEEKEIIYYKKEFMTKSEYAFYLMLKEIGNEYIIHPQVNLATIINKQSKDRYANELFRNIDFAIFDRDYKNILLLIELNDSSHNQYKRKERDKKVKAICQEINMPLMTFYTHYSNRKEYVVDRVLQEIKKPNNDINIDEEITN